MATKKRKRNTPIRKGSERDKNAIAAQYRRAGETHSEAYRRLFGSKRKAKNPKRRVNPKSVYDGAGKLVGRFSRKTAAMVARVVGGTVGKPKANPRRKTGPLLFKSRAAAVKYARANGAKRFSVKKLKRGR